MSSINSVSDSFRDSYLERDSYPMNIIERTISTYPRALSEYARRLDDAADELCESDISKIDVSFRDLQIELDEGGWKGLDKRNIHSPAGLQKWLGIEAVQHEDDDEMTVSVTKRDPKCRFIYIWGKNARSRLQITRSMLVEILTYHQVMPDYLDHLFIFGRQLYQRDLDFVSFREQISPRDNWASPADTPLGRSGKQYQVCYNLKGVSCTYNDPLNPLDTQFSIRQAAVYHRFDVTSGNAVWIVTKGRTDLYERFKELTGSNARPEHRQFQTTEECLRFSLSVHSLFCHWATEDWRGYIKWLEFVIEREDTHESEESLDAFSVFRYYLFRKSHVILMIGLQTRLAVFGPLDKGSHNRTYTAQDVHNILVMEERLREAATVLTSNIEIMNSLSDFYTRLDRTIESEPASRCQDDVAVFIKDLRNIINTFALQVNRARALIKTLTDRKEMVKQYRSETLNEYMRNEAVLVRIVTIVTLVYLPATFTSTFFSTDIIKYQGQESPGGNFSSVAMNRWLEVTVPLTLLTLLLAYAGKRGAEMESRPRDLRDGSRRHWTKTIWRAPWHQASSIESQSTGKLNIYGESGIALRVVASPSPV